METIKRLNKANIVAITVSFSVILYFLLKKPATTQLESDPAYQLGMILSYVVISFIFAVVFEIFASKRREEKTSKAKEEKKTKEKE